MDRTKFLWWVAFFVFLMVAVTWYGVQNAEICWDGVEVDEALLMETCGITQEEYFQGYDLYEECPAGLDAIQMVGGCETDWMAVGGMTIGTAIGYLTASGMVYAVWVLLKKVRGT